MLLTLIANHCVCFALLTVLPHLHASDEAAMLKCKYFGWYVMESSGWGIGSVIGQ